MKCPHCLQAFHEQFYDVGSSMLLGATDGTMQIQHQMCPACKLGIVICSVTRGWTVSLEFVYPKAAARPVPPEVPVEFADDFKEAALVLPDSPKASAALSRRCLQRLIREKGAITGRDLYSEIQALIDSDTLPRHLAESLDTVRVVGNFATHPLKSTNTGEILEVEPHEAEWLLDTLEGMFDFYFVQPTRMAARRDALDRKLADAGKPPLKRVT